MRRIHSFFEARPRRLEIRRDLQAVRITKASAGDAPVWVLIALLVVTAVAAAVAAITGAVDGDVAVGLAGVAAALAGLLVAVLQWRAGLAEKAFDALYNRIGVANQMWLEADEALSNASTEVERKRAEELYRFYVFTELDSLEYAIRRYRFGLGMNEDIANRAVLHFENRCRSEHFREAAGICADDGGYFEDTKESVRAILRRIRQPDND